MVYIGKELNAMGCEGFNFDTAGSIGDAKRYHSLRPSRLGGSRVNAYTKVPNTKDLNR